MTRDEAVQYIRNHAKDYLTADKSGKGYICPICGSGTGNKGTGITTKDGIHFTCWRGCFTSNDIIDIIGLKNGLRADDFSKKLQMAADDFNITIEREQTVKSTQSTIHNTQYTTKENTEDKDFSEYFRECAERVKNTDYFTSRGLSEEIIEKYQLGYDDNYMSHKAVIIPTGKASFVARFTAQSAEYRYRKTGNSQIYLKSTLAEASSPIFVVEGEIDALSIVEVGGEAVGLGSTSNYKKLLLQVQEKKPVQPLILALDNDKAGNETAEILERELAAMSVSVYRYNPYGNAKDANEALQADREALRALVERAVEHIQEEENAKREAAIEELRKESAGQSLQNFMDNIVNSADAPFYPTGFSGLDKILDGGLYAGLYIMGAVSSLGKTTFCMQIVDEIAKSGTDVLVFSLEMGRDELIAKSVSRLTFLNDFKYNQDTRNAKTTRGILTGARYSNYSGTELEIIKKSIEDYGKYADHIFISEGIGDIGINQIKEKVQRHTQITGKAPVVFIDYLQIISPYDPRMSEKQNMDKLVMELKRLSRDYKTPVLCVSSFNRDNYTTPVNTASFKESGSIEYSSDVLIALQYMGMEYKDEDENGDPIKGESSTKRDQRVRQLLKQVQEDGKNGKPITIQAKVLKNRNGTKGSSEITFFPMFNYFTENANEIPLNDEKENENTSWKTSSSTGRYRKGRNGK